jgi:uncharacterized protein YndB with AHSA1/START domain
MAARKTEFVINPKKPTVVMKRVFDAPRSLVWEAMTRPEYLTRWYGPHGFEVTLCEMDARPGGAYRIVQRAPDGSEFGFRGVHREVVPPSRIVYTWIFEPMPDKVAVVTATFEEQDAKTTLTSTIEFQSLEDRDGYLSTGATAGGEMSMNRLEEVIAGLQ